MVVIVRQLPTPRVEMVEQRIEQLMLPAVPRGLRLTQARRGTRLTRART